MSAGGAGGPALGIDVVDLEHPRCRGKAGDRRFVARVFTEAEASAIAESADADCRLWTLWAAKEAGFKAATLAAGAPPVFRHRAFEVVLEPGAERGRVVYEGRSYDLDVTERDGHVVALARFVDRGDVGGAGVAGAGAARVGLVRHGVATHDEITRALGLENATLERLRARLRPDEARSVHSVRSALARLALRRDAARWLGIDETRLSVVCPGGRTGRVPPRLLDDDGVLEAVSVSLSHDGRWLAWALCAYQPGR